jgi:amino acid transporter
VLLIANAESNTLGVFVPGDEGLKPAFQGMIFCLLAFIGFEAAAPLGEETREPRRTIPRAVVWSAILVGLFYVFNYYAATVFFGPEEMSGFYTAHDGDPWGFMAESVLPGIGGLLIVFAILNSSIANANAGATAATRSLFAMGRASLLPRFFAAVHPETRAPVNAVHFQAITAIVIAVVLGLVLANDPFPTPEGAASFGGLNVYVFLGTMLGLIFAGIYILVNLACIGYYWRARRDEFSWIRHGLVPVLGVIAMIPALLAVIGGLTIPILDIELPPYESALRWTAPIVGIWVILGVVAYFVLRARNPEALERVNYVYGGDTAVADVDDGRVERTTS